MNTGLSLKTPDGRTLVCHAEENGFAIAVYDEVEGKLGEVLVESYGVAAKVHVFHGKQDNPETSIEFDSRAV